MQWNSFACAGAIILALAAPALADPMQTRAMGSPNFQADTLKMQSEIAELKAQVAKLQYSLEQTQQATIKTKNDLIQLQNAVAKSSNDAVSTQLNMSKLNALVQAQGQDVAKVGSNLHALSQKFACHLHGVIGGTKTGYPVDLTNGTCMQK